MVLEDLLALEGLAARRAGGLGHVVPISRKKCSLLLAGNLKIQLTNASSKDNMG